jgi:hypothetical protein
MHFDLLPTHLWLRHKIWWVAGLDAGVAEGVGNCERARAGGSGRRFRSRWCTSRVGARSLGSNGAREERRFMSRRCKSKIRISRFAGVRSTTTRWCRGIGRSRS